MPVDGICVFCHSPLDKEDHPIELLDYRVERIPIAKVKRGHLNRGPLTEVVFELGGRTLRARWNKEQLGFQPPVRLTASLERLLSRLGDTAAPDVDLPRAV